MRMTATRAAAEPQQTPIRSIPSAASPVAACPARSRGMASDSMWLPTTRGSPAFGWAIRGRSPGGVHHLRGDDLHLAGITRQLAPTPSHHLPGQVHYFVVRAPRARAFEPPAVPLRVAGALRRIGRAHVILLIQDLTRSLSTPSPASSSVSSPSTPTATTSHAPRNDEHPNPRSRGFGCPECLETSRCLEPATPV